MPGFWNIGAHGKRYTYTTNVIQSEDEKIGKRLVPRYGEGIGRGLEMSALETLKKRFILCE